MVLPQQLHTCSHCKHVELSLLTVQVVVEWVEVSAGVLLVVPVKVEPELLTCLHHLLLLTLTTLDITHTAHKDGHNVGCSQPCA